MRNDLQAAVAHLEAMAQNAIGAAADADMPEQQKTALWAEYNALDTAISALRDMLKRREGCWHCHGIEAHEIEYVTELKNAYLEHIKAPEAIPYRHCANCGRELSGNAEQVKEGEDETKIVEVEG